MALGDTPYTLIEWNELLDAINDLNDIAPSGCEPIEPLLPVTDPHKLSTADIEAARERLLEICDTTEFTIPLASKWKVTTVQELLDAIDAGWCGCEVECDTFETTVGVPITMDSDHPENDPPFFYWHWSNAITGLVVGAAGIYGRYWELWVDNGAGFGLQMVASGPIDCDGTIKDMWPFLGFFPDATSPLPVQTGDEGVFIDYEWDYVTPAELRLNCAELFLEPCE